jgi:hypothetical protein
VIESIDPDHDPAALRLALKMAQAPIEAAR